VKENYKMSMKKVLRGAVLSVAVLSGTAFGQSKVVQINAGLKAVQLARVACPAGSRSMQDLEDLALFCTIGKGGEKMLQKAGPYQSFWANGVRKSQGQYLDGLRTGAWAFFDEQGAKSLEIEFKADEFHGRRVEYFPNGTVRVEQTWVEGRRQGEQKVTDEKGALTVTHFKDDLVVSN
jgi:hypothetical protein